MPGLHHNALVSPKTSDSGLQAHLHPLVLLTISDLIARRSLRRQEGPLVGALFGQQKGREISLEHATECRVIQRDDGASILHDDWFKDRAQQYRDVHKAPALEVVGWFTTAPVTGPESEHLIIHEQILQGYNETALLLAFHPSTVLEGASVGGKLPLTIYESVYESTSENARAAAQADADGDSKMQGDGQEGHLELKFRELPYSVETGEAEMIGVDYVAKGAGNATAVDTVVKDKGKNQASQTPVGTVESQKTGKTVDDASILSPEDDELITSLTARANAVKMLHARIQLLKTYLQNLPPSYLTSAADDQSKATPTVQHTEINHPILRSIQALLNRLPLLAPASQESFEEETLAQKSDVSLVSLLGSLSNNVKDARELGRKFAIVEQSKQHNKRGAGQWGGIGSKFGDDTFGNGQEEEGPFLGAGGMNGFGSL
ncbi:COP9 signalosome complex subunit 6 [Physcia stellaris]|nr:COP9 signalosome complex subunit 6 [Physcia stellaris]